MTDRVTAEKIAQLRLGETVTLPTKLEASSGARVLIECYLIPSLHERRWILVTAFAGQVVIGFVDGMFYGTYSTSKVESPHTMHVIDENFPHTAIRFEAGDDGIYIVDGERGRGVGRELMLTIRSIFIGLGAKVMYVNQPKESAFDFYRSLGMTEILGAFQEIFDPTDTT